MDKRPEQDLLPTPDTPAPWTAGRRRPATRSVMLGVLLLLVAVLNLAGVLDKGRVTAFVEATSERTLASFAIARVINAGISVIQEAEIGVSIGVSANLKPGQVLDPINDLVERFSLMMLVSATAFWILRIFGEILYDPVLLSVLVGLYAAGLLLVTRARPFMQTLGGLVHHLVAMVFAAVCFASLTPVLVETVHGSDFVQGHYQASFANLNRAGEDLGTLADLSSEWNIGKQLEQALAKATHVTERITQEFVVQLAVIVLETILIPLLALWLCLRFITYELRQLFAMRWVTGPA